MKEKCPEDPEKVTFTGGPLNLGAVWQNCLSRPRSLDARDGVSIALPSAPLLYFISPSCIIPTTSVPNYLQCLTQLNPAKDGLSAVSSPAPNGFWCIVGIVVVVNA